LKKRRKLIKNQLKSYFYFILFLSTISTKIVAKNAHENLMDGYINSPKKKIKIGKKKTNLM